ncbi:MAG TPA: trigger factor, partial [Planctomycetota bacterium]|nr:trigger factor [Planctomycetota bacterium]
CRRTLAFTVDRAALETEIERRVQAMAQRARFKGFRPGHTPIALVRKTYGKEAANEARQAVMTRAYQDAVAEHKLVPVSQPELKLDLLSDDDNGPFTFTLRVEVAPDIELKTLEDIPVTVTLADVNDAMVEGEVTRFQQQGATLEPAADDAAVSDDSVLNATIVYTVDGQAQEPRADRPVFPKHDIVDGVQVAGSGALFRGKKLHDTVELQADLPGHFQPAELAGKHASLAVTIDQHRLMVVPPLGPELLDRAGVANEAELREKIREQLDLQRVRFRDEAIDRALEAWLVEQHPVELPDGMLAKAIDRRVHEVAHKLMEDQGLDSETGHSRAEAERERIAEATRKALHASFLLAKVAREQSLAATMDETTAQMMELARSQNQDPAKLLEDARKEGWFNDVAAQVTEAKTREWLRAKAKVTEVAPPPPAPAAAADAT